MTKKRLELYLYISIIATIIALLFTFFYGAFQHERYWNGTIKRVQNVEANLLKEFFTLEFSTDFVSRNETNLFQIFETVKDKIPVVLLRGKEIIYSNINTKYSLSDSNEIIPLSDTSYLLSIGRYDGPKWGDRFIDWMSHPNQWFTFHYDYLTVPFFTAFCIFYIFLYALSWRVRANHLSNDVLQGLKDFEEKA